MSRAAVSVAVTAPSRPNFGGPHVRAYADGTRCAEGSRRRSISYAKGVATPTVLLAGWPGHPIRRRSRLLAVGVSSHSYSETLTRSSTMHVSAHLYALVKDADCLCTTEIQSTCRNYRDECTYRSGRPSKSPCHVPKITWYMLYSLISSCRHTFIYVYYAIICIIYWSVGDMYTTLIDITLPDQQPAGLSQWF
jgi:hypothetical protein